MVSVSIIDEERAAIMEYDGGLPRAEAERLARVTAEAAQPDMKAAALALAANGYHVLPCWGAENGACDCPNSSSCASPAKHPIPALVPHGLKEATTDPEIIRRWWDAYPQANIAIATGAISGIIVFDVDLDKPGAGDALIDFVTKYGALEYFAEVLTGSGGAHYYMDHPGGVVRNGTDVFGPGLDLKGDGGYVIAPPSLHASGHRYVWAGRRYAFTERGPNAFK